MKRAALSLMLSFAVAGSLYAAQNPSPSPQPSNPSSPASPAPSSPASPASQSSQPKPADVTLTGCLVQGSSPSVFILENAKASTDPATSKGKSYVVSVTGAADLKPHLNHQVRIVGSEGMASASPSSSPSSASRDSSPSSSSQSASSKSDDEKDYPRLSARTVTMVANTCPAA